MLSGERRGRGHVGGCVSPVTMLKKLYIYLPSRPTETITRNSANAQLIKSN